MSTQTLFSAAELARLIGAPLSRTQPGGTDVPLTGVSIDSRTLQSGALFVALPGEHVDGHDYVQAAQARGAAAALVNRHVDCSLPQLRVDDVLAALQQAAAAWRMRFRLPLIAVTGSNGKTTTKQMLAAILATRGEVLATQGNLNNHIGVPLTLLKLLDAHRAAVVEMGANHAGEIALLAKLAQPTIGVVTQAGDAHLEGFGSRDGVAHAKGELFAALGAEGTAVINADDAYAPLWRELAQPARVLEFGFSTNANVRAFDVRDAMFDGVPGSSFTLVIEDRTQPVELALPGRHNVMNTLAAAAAAHAAGIDLLAIASGLRVVEGAVGRLNCKTLRDGIVLIDDSYNANPGSLRAALQMLDSLPGRHHLVLGAMAELGPQSAQLHRQAGVEARAYRIDAAYVLGAAAPFAEGLGASAKVYEDITALQAALLSTLRPGDAVLVKGSRSARMERVCTTLLDSFAPEPGLRRAGGEH